MEALLLKESLDNIFSDLNLLECVDNPDLCLHTSCPKDECSLQSSHKKASTSQAKSSGKAKPKALNKLKKRETNSRPTGCLWC